MECSICLSKCTFPVELKCNHIFCYLCIKGASNVNKTCPLCRKKISVRILKKPKLVHDVNATMDGATMDGATMDDQMYMWFYSGRDGWWCYDHITSQFIENAFQNGEKFCDVMISGFLYKIDFNKNVQYRIDYPQKKRNIKRDRLCDTIDNAKGVAGVSKDVNRQLFNVFAPPKQSDSNESPHVSNDASSDATAEVSSEVIEITKENFKCEILNASGDVTNAIVVNNDSICDD